MFPPSIDGERGEHWRAKLQWSQISSSVPGGEEEEEEEGAHPNDDSNRMSKEAAGAAEADGVGTGEARRNKLAKMRGKMRKLELSYCQLWYLKNMQFAKKMSCRRYFTFESFHFVIWQLDFSLLIQTTQNSQEKSKKSCSVQNGFYSSGAQIELF